MFHMAQTEKYISIKFISQSVWNNFTPNGLPVNLSIQFSIIVVHRRGVLLQRNIQGKSTAVATVVMRMCWLVARLPIIG
jgi:hypothetical protein